MKEKIKGLLSLFISFARIGALTFGGGLAMLPMLKNEIVEKKGWTTEEELLDYYAIGQCTPGIIAVNTATFIGDKQHGALGGIVATLGMVSPSLLIITLIATVLNGILDVPVVAHGLRGISAVVCALMMNTVISLAKKSLTRIAAVIIYVAVIALSLAFDISSVLIVISAGVIGVILGAVDEKKQKKAEDANGKKGDN